MATFSESWSDSEKPTVTILYCFMLTSHVVTNRDDSVHFNRTAISARCVAFTSTALSVSPCNYNRRGRELKKPVLALLAKTVFFSSEPFVYRQECPFSRINCFTLTSQVVTTGDNSVQDNRTTTIPEECVVPASTALNASPCKYKQVVVVVVVAVVVVDVVVVVVVVVDVGVVVATEPSEALRTQTANDCPRFCTCRLDSLICRVRRPTCLLVLLINNREGDIQSTFGFSGYSRIGEASNPGPPNPLTPNLTLTSVNVTSLQSRIRHLQPLIGQKGICCCQETAVTQAAFLRVQTMAKEEGWDSLMHGPWAAPREREARATRRAYRERGLTGGGGVGILAAGIKGAPLPIPPLSDREPFWDTLSNSGRWNASVFPLPMGSALFVHNIYLPTRARQIASTRHEAEEILRATFLAASMHGTAPTGICGDMNMAPDDSQVWDQAVSTGQWHDALQAFAHIPDTPERVHGCVSTHFPTWESWISKKGGARIDRIFVNSSALRLLKDAWVVPNRIPGGHLPLGIEFEMATASQQGLFWKCPKPYQVPKPPEQGKWTDQLKKEEQELRAKLAVKHFANIHKAIARKDSLVAWSLIETLCDDYLAHKDPFVGTSKEGQQKPFAPEYLRRNLLPKVRNESSESSMAESKGYNLIQRMKELIALVKYSLKSDLDTRNKVQQQIDNLWPKVKRANESFLKKEEDTQGIRDYSWCPPTQALEATLDLYQGKYSATLLAASRDKLAAAKKIFEETSLPRQRNAGKAFANPDLPLLHLSLKRVRMDPSNSPRTLRRYTRKSGTHGPRS